MTATTSMYVVLAWGCYRYRVVEDSINSEREQLKLHLSLFEAVLF